MKPAGHDRRRAATSALWAACVAVPTALDVALSASFSTLHALTLAFGALPLAARLAFRREPGRSGPAVLEALAWATAAAGLMLAAGGSGWLFAAWFLAPVAASFVLKSRRELVETTAFSVVAAGLVLALRLTGGTPLDGIGAQPGLLPALSAAAVALFMAGCLWLGRESHGDGRLRENMLDLAPVALLKLSRDGGVRSAAGALADVFPEVRASSPRRIDDVFSGPALEDVYGSLAAVAASGEPIGFRVDAEGVAYDLRFTRMRDGDILLAARDASVDAAYAKRLEQERDKARTGAAERTKFFASMTHELRTPLNAVLGFSDAMREKLFGPLPAKYAEYAELINESARHMLDIVGDVVDASRVDAGSFELERSDFDAVELLKSTVRLVGANAEKKSLTVSFSAPDGEIAVNADRRALRQMVLNLLSNAIKFTPEKGRVETRVLRDGPDLVVEVTDTGVGMTSEELQRLGRPFEQTASGRSTEQRGSGLGLAVVRGFAQLHGGTLEASSAPGEGSTIRIRMPVLKAHDEGERFDARARMDRIRKVDWTDEPT